MARPARAEEPAKPYTLRLTDDERKQLEAAARANRQRPADFARDALVTAAADCLEESTT